MADALNTKKVAMIVAAFDFRDEEYFVPKDLLESRGVKVATVSTAKGTAYGIYGGEVKVDLLIADVAVADYDAIIFIGGGGALKYLDNPESYRIISETIANNRILAAICISPVILAKAGALKGKKATVWSDVLDKTAVKILESNGAVYTDLPVVVDNKIITATGPEAATGFGQEIIRQLTE